MSAPRPAEIRAHAVELYADGMPSTAVATYLGCVSASSVITWAREAGVEIRGVGQPRQPTDEDAFTGQWVRVGLVMRPVMGETA